MTHHTLFVIHHATRAIRIGATTDNPNGVFMAEVAHILTDPVDGFLRKARFLILDRDTKFTARFVEILNEAGIARILCPARAPNCNALAERFVGSLRRELLDRMVFFGVDSLRRSLRSYEAHFLEERNHQGIDNVLIAPIVPIGHRDGRVIRRQRLGGLLSFYHRRPAA